MRQTSNCGAGTRLQWLPDGSGYVVSAGAGYALVNVASASVHPLPFGRTHPVPAPDGSGRFLLNGDVVDSTGLILREQPNGLNRDWYWGLVAWSPDALQIRYTIPILDGFDSAACGASDLGLSPRVEFPPFDDRVFLRVTGVGTCLNVREAPGLSERSVVCASDGTVVQLADATDAAEYCNGTQVCSIAAHYVDTDRRWIHVRLLDGTEGWAATGFFEHADPPAE